MTRRILLFIVGIIFIFQAYLLTFEPANRQSFELSILERTFSSNLVNKLSWLTKVSISELCSQELRVGLIAILAAGAYSCIFAHQMGFAMLGQILYLASQINAIDFTLANIKFIGVQMLILVIVVTGLVHYDFEGKIRSEESGDVNSQSTGKAIHSENIHNNSGQGGSKKKKNK